MLALLSSGTRTGSLLPAPTLNNSPLGLSGTHPTLQPSHGAYHEGLQEREREEHLCVYELVKKGTNAHSDMTEAKHSFCQKRVVEMVPDANCQIFLPRGLLSTTALLSSSLPF